jgi:hypothetical protein
MKFKKSILGLSGAILTVAAPLLLAQAVAGAGPMKAGPWGGMRGGFGFRGPATGAPYSAVRTTTHVQTLANGTSITDLMTVKEARDGEGRTYREETVERNGNSFVSSQVFDPVSHVAISWNSKTQQASLIHLPDRSQFKPTQSGDEPTIAGAARPTGLHRNGLTPNVENLGSRTIGGVTADGTRTSFVIPAGKEGNSDPLTITHESWISSDLKLEVLRIDSDPRSGTTTMELSNIDRNEPQPNLFQAPEGYTVQERSRGKLSTP